MPLVVAALMPGAVEKVHERRAADLASAVDTWAGRDRTAAPYSHDLLPARAARTGRQVVVRTPDPGGAGGHVIGLVHHLPADVVLAELHSRYGDELWAPVHEWLHEQPVGGDARVAASLAAGLADLGRVDRGLADAVLRGWACDRDGGRRWMAAVAVARLHGEDGTSGRALALARAWSRGSQQEKITAAHTFGLDISQHRPVEAIGQLWNLTFDDAVVAYYARAQLMALAWLATKTSVGLRRLVAVVAHMFDHLVEEVPSDDPRIDRALLTVARILSVRSADAIPLTTWALDAHPDLAPLLGHLWAQVLRSWEHRVAALDELQPVLARPDTPVTAALGQAIHHDLSAAEWRWLCRDIGIDIDTRTGSETVEAVR